MECSEHKGHRIYVGGPLDGFVQHLVYATPSDFPTYWTFPARDHAMYFRDLDTEGTDVIYRFVGTDEKLVEAI